MRVAYLILAHDQPHLLDLLTTTLDPRRRDIFIHIDAKSDLRRFRIGSVPTAHVVTSECKVYWGHVSMLRACLSLLRAARRAHAYDYFVLLSGADFPTRSLDEFERFLEAADGRTFQPVRPALASFEGRKRLRSYYMLNTRTRVGVLAQKFLFLQSFLGAWGGRRPPRRFARYFLGSMWFTLHRDMADWLLRCWQDEEVRDYFQTVFCPEEMFIPTAVSNSPWPERHEDRSVRYIRWTGGANPKTLDLSDLDGIRRSGAFFARKMSLERSIPLLDLLAREVHGLDASTILPAAPAPHLKPKGLRPEMSSRAMEAVGR